MKTLRRYLVREVLLSTLLVLGALLMLYLVVDFLNEFQDGARRGGLSTLLITLANVPANMYLLLPIAALLGSLFTLAQLNANSEYTVMRASGVSVAQIVLPLIGLGFAIAVFGFALAEYVVPAAESYGQRVRAFSGSTKNVVQRFKSGYWFRERETFINIGDMLPDTRLANVRIFEFNPDGQLVTLTRAASAAHISDSRWELKDVHRMRVTPERIVSEVVAKESWRSVLTPNMLAVLQVQPDRLSASSLWEYTQHLRRNNQRSNRFEAALWGKFLYPLAACMLIVLALPFAQVSRRSGGVGLRIFIGILIGLIFLLSNRLFSFLGLIYNWPPMMAAIAPYLIFLVLTVAMIQRVERR